jgi:hypothetical protein
MLNRAAIILRYKAPAVQWINDADSYEEGTEVTLDAANRDRPVYLISDQDAENDDVVAGWIELNYESLFEGELDGWYTDDSLWPDNLTLNLFYEWFDVECHTVIEDTVGVPIEDDEER